MNAGRARIILRMEPYLLRSALGYFLAANPLFDVRIDPNGQEFPAQSEPIDDPGRPTVVVLVVDHPLGFEFRSADRAATVPYRGPERLADQLIEFLAGRPAVNLATHADPPFH